MCIRPVLVGYIGLLAAVPSNVALAQEPTYFPELPGAPVRQELLKEITLDDKQMSDLETLAGRLHQRMRELQPTMGDASREERRAKIRDLMLEHADEIRKFLAAEQQRRFDANRERWLKGGDILERSRDTIVRPTPHPVGTQACASVNAPSHEWTSLPHQFVSLDAFHAQLVAH